MLSFRDRDQLAAALPTSPAKSSLECRGYCSPRWLAPTSLRATESICLQVQHNYLSPLLFGNTLDGSKARCWLEMSASIGNSTNRLRHGAMGGVLAHKEYQKDFGLPTGKSGLPAVKMPEF